MAAITVSNVEPGDLITANLLNQLAEAVRSLDVRVSAIESGELSQRPVLLDRSPLGDIEVNSSLTLIGRNFLSPSSRNTVVLGGVPITQFGSADDQHLQFTVPDVFSGLPRSVSLFVRTDFGESTQLQVRLLPRAPQQSGQVVVFNQTPPLGQIIVGQPYDFSWLVDSQTQLPVNYNLTVVFTNIVGASASLWNLGTVLTPTGPRQISAGNPLPIGARITVPAGATSVDVALRAESTDLQFVRTSDAIALTVGSTPTVSDPRVLVTLAAIPPFDPATGLPNSVREAVIDSVNGVEVRFGASGQIPINVHVTGTAAAAGTYTYTATVESAGTLWTPGTVVPATSGQAAPSDRVLSVGIHNTDTSHSTAVRFMRVTATHQTSAGVQDFASFIRFPIRGIV